MLIARVVRTTDDRAEARREVSVSRGLETVIARASASAPRARAGVPERAASAQTCLQQLLPLIGAWDGPTHLLEREMAYQGSVPGRDFIQDLPPLDPQALSTVDGQVFALENTPSGIVLRDSRSRDIQLALWHEPLVQAFRLGTPGSAPHSGEQILVEHVTAEPVPGGLYPISDAGLASLPAGEWTLEYFLEWREYYGSNSAMTERLVRFARGVVDGAVGAVGQVGRCVRLAAYETGFAVAKVVCVARRAAPEVALGPAIWAELRHAGNESRPDLAHADLRDVAPAHAAKPAEPPPVAVVLVHGTLSSAGAAFEHLDKGGVLLRGRVPLHTFEHDTFQSIGSNAKELAALIRARLHETTILILAHSRGGLVARQAAYLLRGHLPHPIETFTFGTPHEGTALVRDLRSLIRPLAFAGGRVDGALPLPTPRLARLAYLATQMNALPHGLSDMDPDSSFLTALNEYPMAADLLRTYGGTFDGRLAPMAGLAFIGGVADAALPHPNDGVVPLESSLWSSRTSTLTSETIDYSNHFQYFSRGESRVGARISDWVGSALYVRQVASDQKSTSKGPTLAATLKRLRKPPKL